MIYKIRTTALITTLLSVLLMFFLTQSPVSAASCKDLSKSRCGASSSCSWVGGYTTKKGVKVSSFCRSKPGSGATKAKKKSVAKKSVAKKKKSSKSAKKKDKAAKVKSKSKKEKKKKATKKKKKAPKSKKSSKKKTKKKKKDKKK